MNHEQIIEEIKKVGIEVGDILLELTTESTEDEIKTANDKINGLIKADGFNDITMKVEYSEEQESFYLEPTDKKSTVFIIGVQMISQNM